MARHGMARHGMAWHGMAWHGMAWHVTIPWHGMAWHDAPPVSCPQAGDGSTPLDSQASALDDSGGTTSFGGHPRLLAAGAARGTRSSRATVTYIWCGAAASGGRAHEMSRIRPPFGPDSTVERILNRTARPSRIRRDPRTANTANWAGEAPVTTRKVCQCIHIAHPLTRKRPTPCSRTS